MMEGENPTTIYFETYELSEEEIFEEYGQGLTDLKTMDAVIENLIERRENVINGGVNCIPLPFQRFRSEIPGVEQGQYIILTANQKVSPCLI